MENRRASQMEERVIMGDPMIVKSKKSNGGLVLN